MTRPRDPGARDPGARLVAAILAHAAAAGCPATLVAAEQREWASATFIGLRQRLVFALPPGPTRAGWLAGIGEAAFTIPGHCLADLATFAVADPQQVGIETLLLASA